MSHDVRGQTSPAMHGTHASFAPCLPQQDFYRLGGEDKGWTVDLCRLDSDKDGATNGQELGDPDCTVSVPLPHMRTVSGMNLLLDMMGLSFNILVASFMSPGWKQPNNMLLGGFSGNSG